MKYKINGDLEKHLLNGCTIIEKQSVNYKTSEGDYTHILLQCPKEYKLDHVKDERFVCYIALELMGDKNLWFDATWYYSNKRHAIKSFYDNLTEDRISQMRIKEAQQPTKL